MHNKIKDKQMQREKHARHINILGIMRRKFTLIKLFVVIAIIAILAAILLPPPNQAKARGRDVACTGNLKSQFGAASFYAMAYTWYPALSMLRQPITTVTGNSD